MESRTGLGSVVVNRAMSLDGFVAAPGDAMDWIFGFFGQDDFPEVMAATGAMLIGRRTYEVGKRMAVESGGEQGGDGYDGGAKFVLTHLPPPEPDPSVTFLTGDLREAVATALAAAEGKDLEILGTDLAGQCLRQGLVDRILVYVLPVLLGDGTRLFASDGLERIDLEPLDTVRSGAVTMLTFQVRR